MSFPNIPATATSTLLTQNQADTTATRTFPSLTTLNKSHGNLLVAVILGYRSNATNAAFSSWGAGFTEFLDSGTSTTGALGAAYKWCDMTESGTFTVTQATVTGHASMILMAIAGAHASTVPEAGSRADGTAAAADPASFDPGGWAAEDTLWIAVGGSEETSTTGSYTGLASAPTNFTGYADTGMTADAVGACELAVAFRQQNASAQDVAGFSVDVSNASNSAAVIAVRPGVEANLPLVSLLPPIAHKRLF